MNTVRLKMVVLSAAFVSLVFGSAAGAITTLTILRYSDGDQSTTNQATLNSSEPSFSYAWNQAAPAVVSVVEMKDVSQYYNMFFMGEQQAPSDSTEPNLQKVAAGTAFVISSDGLAVTNKHVVADESGQYVAFLADGTQVDVKVLAKDTLNDVALLQLSSKDVKTYSTVEFGDSDAMSVGDHVIAIGNAEGEYSNTTTAGIISATGRQIIAGGGNEAAKSLTGLIQTDAAINPGNSGGPLVNLSGQVVGMNTAVDSSSQGIGFAIASNEIQRVVKSYQEYGRIVRPYLGVRYMIITPALGEKNGLSVDHGAYVVADVQAGLLPVLKGSPADKAGLKEGDIILSLDGKEISQNFDLSNAISAYSVGDKVKLEVLRDGKNISLSVKLEERPEETK